MSKPIFIRIYEDYKKYIILGVYKPGDKLPSVREVAEEKGINPHTVNRAFMMLEEEGYVKTIFKKGSFVRERVSESEVIKQVRKDIKVWKEKGISEAELLTYIKKCMVIKMIEIKNVSKSFEKNEVLKELSLTIKKVRFSGL